MAEHETKAFEGWAILELMGHRRLAGYVRQEEQFGRAMLRIDVPAASGPAVTQWYGPEAIYCLTPTTEEIAQGLAKRERPAPVHPFELPAPSAANNDRCPECQEYSPGSKTCARCAGPY